MQISSINSYNTPKTSFKSFTITPQAMEMAKANAERFKTVTRAERLFKHSAFIDFAILDKFIPKISLKHSSESLIDKISADVVGEKALRITDSSNRSMEFVLPLGYTAEYQKNLINGNLYNKADAASHVAELLELSGEDHNGRFLL